jgi:hypothetical protein
MGWNPGKGIGRNERYIKIFIYTLICISIWKHIIFPHFKENMYTHVNVIIYKYSR